MSEEREVREALEKIFNADTGIYAQRGFQRRRHRDPHGRDDVRRDVRRLEPLERVLEYLRGIETFTSRV